MAVRRKLRHDEETRNKIQASQLINRLTDHVFGRVEMNATQVSAALGLLKKSIPDLAAVTVEGESQTRVIHVVERIIIDRIEHDGRQAPYRNGESVPAITNGHAL